MKQRTYLWINALSICVGFVLIALVMSWISVTESLLYLKQLDSAYIAPILVFGVLATVVRAARYYHFFPVPGRLRDLYTAFAYIRAANYALPLGLGEPISLVLLKKRNLAPSITKTMPAWILFRVCDVLSILLLGAGLSFFTALPETGWLKNWSQILFLALIAVTVLIRLYWTRIRSLGTQFRARFGDGIFGDQVAKFSLGLGHISSARSVFFCFVASLAVWLFNIALIVCGLLAFSVPVSIAVAGLASTIALAFSIMPIRPPLGIGIHESVWVGLLILAGLDKEQALAGAIAARSALIFVIVAESMICFSIDVLLGQSGELE